MKIRHGFVSNSSSSSFVVCFPKGFEVSEDNVKAAMFPAGDNTVHYYEYAISVESIVKCVTREMLAQTPNNIDSIISTISEDHEYDDYPKYPQITRETTPEEMRAAWDKFDEEKKEYIDKQLPGKKVEFENFDVYSFSYSDNDGNFYCTMEHGEIFSNLKHVRISHH